MMADCAESHKITFEIDYTYFTKPEGWILLTELIWAILSIACCGPAPFPTQVYFLIIVCSAFIVTFCLILLHLRFAHFNDYARLTEFVYTVTMSLFCFTAFVSQFADLNGFLEDAGQAYRWPAQIAAAVFALIYDIALFASAGLQFRGARSAFESITGTLK